MDRLDYIIRDSNNLKYGPVIKNQKVFVKYLRGLTLKKTKIIGKPFYPDENVELCLDDTFIEEAFCLLISRVLLYQYIYFSPRVRCFEATLTFLVGELIQKSAMSPYKLMTIGDDDFIKTYLGFYVNKIVDISDKDNLIKDYYKAIRNDKASKFERLISIDPKSILNPRLKQELKLNIDSRSYLKHLKDAIVKESNKKINSEEVKIEDEIILLDIYNLQTGGGDFLVFRNKDKATKTLFDYMNGSNIHRLCSQQRLDIYIQRDVNEECRNKVKTTIDRLFKTYNNDNK